MRFSAALDPPGETRRQVISFGIWVGFLLVAVVTAASTGRRAAAVAPLDSGEGEVQAAAPPARRGRLEIALLLGILAPAATVYVWSRRYRRNGAHPRGITVELTEGELRVWGRGYGTRV